MHKAALDKLQPIVIIGAGPAGLGAAHCLEELGIENWILLEQEDDAGGLARSFLDEKGFTWDLGGHVVFSHYDHVTSMLQKLLPENEWLRHERVSMVRYSDRWISYPFQRNVHRLPEPDRKHCLDGLFQAAKAGPKPKGLDFEALSIAVFGKGIVDHFLRPYNWKVWAYDPKNIDADWIEDRVSPPDLARLMEYALKDSDDAGWGPNDKFWFPRTGGTGRIWKESLAHLPSEKIRLNSKVVGVDLQKKSITIESGETFRYEQVLSTMPLTHLVKATGDEGMIKQASILRHSAVHVVGVGMKGRAPISIDPHCWMYFPDLKVPFYRVTHFSRYSPMNVPQDSPHWSLMAEISESVDKPVDQDKVVEETLQGMVASGLLERKDQAIHTWHRRIAYGYPTPYKGYRAASEDLLVKLKELGIYSRGRFGTWIYEVGNMDHSYMQGREAILNMAFGSPELTLWEPGVVNRKHRVLGWGRSQ